MTELAGTHPKIRHECLQSVQTKTCNYNFCDVKLSSMLWDMNQGEE